MLYGSPSRPKIPDPLRIHDSPRPPQDLPLRPGIRQPRPDPLPDQLPFELGEGRQEMEHQLSGRRRKIKVLVIGTKGHPQGPQLIEGVD